jgi:hypothetical protein
LSIARSIMRHLSPLLIGTLFVHHADGFSAVIPVVTGPKGKPATSYEDDLRLTMQIIMDHAARSTTVSTEQMLSQMAAGADVVQTIEDVDVSIPYDAPARLAFEASSDKSMDYASFKEQFEANAVADVIAKKSVLEVPPAAAVVAQAVVAETLVTEPPPVVTTTVDISIPYDAAAKLAFGSSDKSTDYATFKEKFEADAVADVIAKRTPVTEVPSAAAVVAEAAVVSKAPVVEKTPPAAEAVDISIPYDAAAKLAFESSDKSMDYAAFKEKFEADAVADVVSKRTPVPKAPSATVKPTEIVAEAVVVEPVVKEQSGTSAIDISIPYDAPAKLAYETSDKSMDYAAFKSKFEADAVADVVAKKSPKLSVKAPAHAQTIDISVPYDAAAKLAYEASNKSTSYEEFRSKYEADAVAAVKSKRQ